MMTQVRRGESGGLACCDEAGGVSALFIGSGTVGGEPSVSASSTFRLRKVTGWAPIWRRGRGADIGWRFISTSMSDGAQGPTASGNDIEPKKASTVGSG
jgi:hypothetical protein